MPMHFEWIVPTLDVVSRDNIPVKIDVVVYLRKPNISMIVVADYLDANDQFCRFSCVQSWACTAWTGC